MLFPIQILDEISEHGIRIYQLPDADSDEDEEFKEQTRVLKVRWLVSPSSFIKMKFCVVGYLNIISCDLCLL